MKIVKHTLTDERPVYDLNLSESNSSTMLGIWFYCSLSIVPESIRKLEV